MAQYANDITFNGTELEVVGLNPTREQKTRKTKIGKTLVETPILGLDAQQWRLQISGVITSNIGTTRAVIEALDDVTAYAYVDGIHNGNYAIVPGSLTFQDSEADVGMIYRYNVTLLEW